MIHPLDNRQIKPLITAAALRARTSELAAQLSTDYDGKILDLVIIANGAIVFAADLIRKLTISIRYDVYPVSSYRGTASTGALNVRSDLKLPLHHRHVLIIDDILDTGFTLDALMKDFALHHPDSLRCCVLLNKKRHTPPAIIPDYQGFSIDDQFVIGYGLDYNEYYRQLPYIGILHTEHQKACTLIES